MLVFLEDCSWTFPKPPLAPGFLCWLCTAFPQINNPPSWVYARFCLKQSALVPLSSMPGQSKGGGRQTEPYSCPPNKMKPFRAWWGRSGHWVHLKWVIVLYRDNLQDHTAPNCGLSDTLSHVYVHQPQLFFLSFILLFTCLSWWNRLGCILSWEWGKVAPLQMDVMVLVTPPILSPVSSRLRARQTPRVWPPKHSTCHSSLPGRWKRVCVLLFSALIH